MTRARSSGRIRSGVSQEDGHIYDKLLLVLHMQLVNGQQLMRTKATMKQAKKRILPAEAILMQVDRSTPTTAPYRPVSRC